MSVGIRPHPSAAIFGRQQHSGVLTHHTTPHHTTPHHATPHYIAQAQARVAKALIRSVLYTDRDRVIINLEHTLESMAIGFTHPILLGDSAYAYFAEWTGREFFVTQYYLNTHREPNPILMELPRPTSYDRGHAFTSACTLFKPSRPPSPPYAPQTDRQAGTHFHSAHFHPIRSHMAVYLHLRGMAPANIAQRRINHTLQANLSNRDRRSSDMTVEVAMSLEGAASLDVDG